MGQHRRAIVGEPALGASEFQHLRKPVGPVALDVLCSLAKPSNLHRNVIGIDAVAHPLAPEHLRDGVVRQSGGEVSVKAPAIIGLSRMPKKG